MGKAGIRFVLAVWMVAVVLQIRRAIATNKGSWPKPAILVRSTAAFSALGLIAEVQPEVAGALAVGLMLALLVNDPSLINPQ